MRAMLRKIRLRDESGQVLVLTAIAMTALLGMTALAVDVGLMYRTKRNIQIAADAAATAGALDYFNNSSSSSAITAAENAATANGFTDGVGGATVTVTNPVTSGYHTGSGMVKVVITHVNPTIFMRVLGRNSMTVGAKAVAGLNPAGPCIYLMKQGLSISGKSTIEGWDPTTNTAKTGCGIYSEGNVSVTGISNIVNMAFTATSGTLVGNHNTNPAPVVTGAPLESIPASLNITPPAPTSSTFGGSCGLPPGATSSKSKGITTYTATISAMSPDTCYGIGSLDPTKNNLDLTISSSTTLTGGMYGFNLGTATTNKETGGTLTVADATGSGITLDVYTGNFAVTSTNSAGLSAATSSSTATNGAIATVLLLEPSTNTGTINVQWGSAKGKFDGIIDAPGAGVTLQDNGGNALVTGMVAGSLTMGTGVLNVVSYSDAHPGSSPFQNVALME